VLVIDLDPREHLSGMRRLDDPDQTKRISFDLIAVKEQHAQCGIIRIKSSGVDDERPDTSS
jgi:hypothetical protein